MPERPHRLLSPDGLMRTAEEEARIDRAVQGAFGGEAGRQTLAYLRSITIEMVAGPHVTDAELRHREGARALVGILETRLRRKQP